MADAPNPFGCLPIGNLAMILALGQSQKPGPAITIALSNNHPLTFEYEDERAKRWECSALNCDEIAVTVSDTRIAVTDGPALSEFPRPSDEDSNEE
jgi:hypothetical protein